MFLESTKITILSVKMIMMAKSKIYIGISLINTTENLMSNPNRFDITFSVVCQSASYFYTNFNKFV